MPLLSQLPSTAWEELFRQVPAVAGVVLVGYYLYREVVAHQKAHVEDVRAQAKEWSTDLKGQIEGLKQELRAERERTQAERDRYDRLLKVIEAIGGKST